MPAHSLISSKCRPWLLTRGHAPDLLQGGAFGFVRHDKGCPSFNSWCQTAFIQKQHFGPKTPLYSYCLYDLIIVPPTNPYLVTIKTRPKPEDPPNKNR